MAQSLNRLNEGSSRRLRELARENIDRRGDALRIFRPMPNQMPILKKLGTASEFLVRGGQRSGKTVLTAAITASAATGIPLCDCDGNEMPHYFPTDRPLLIWVFGFDERHISVIHRKLFQPGLFRIIEDEETGEWRSWNPADPADADRKHRPSPPMIPPRMIPEKDGWAWRERAGRVFELCRLKNGTEIHAYPSGAEAPTGEAVDVVFIDEALKYGSHIAELQARLSDNRGKLFWSSWPRQSNIPLLEMSQRAQQQEEEVRRGTLDEDGQVIRTHADVVEVCLEFNKNRFIPREEVKKRIQGWSEAERRARDLGEWVLDRVLVYPEFNSEIHCTDGVGCPDKIREILAENNMRPPWNWTHYLALDPGTVQPAVVMAAVPPPEIGDYIVIYDEVYTPNCTADTLARDVATIANSTPFESFICDYRYGRQHQGGSAMSIQQQYAEAFKRHGMKSRQTGSSFREGCDNIEARVGLVHDGLRVRADGPYRGTTRISFVRERVPHTLKEFGLYKKIMDREGVKEKIADRHHDAMDALGYLIAHNLKYVSPDSWKIQNKDPVAAAYFARKAKRAKKYGSNDTTFFGAGTPTTATTNSAY